MKTFCYRLAVLLLLLGATTLRVQAQADEFVGPFTTWANAKTEYGAKGDGTTDDAPVLQKALDELGTPGHKSVLYLPAGTYRLTKPLTLVSREHVAILGESPALVTLKWAGAAGAAMLTTTSVAYSRFGRLRWDGGGVAGLGIFHRWRQGQNFFPTHLEHQDEVFENLKTGLQGGDLESGYQSTAAEVVVARSTFRRCEQGVLIRDYNTVDWWVSDCLFEDNRIGFQVLAGGGHVYHSLFRRSTTADIYLQNSEYSAVRDCYSANSQQFLFVNGPTGDTNALTIQGNTVLDAVGTPLENRTSGPFTLLDNVVRSAAGQSGAAVRLGGLSPGSLISLGNTFTVANPISLPDSYRRKSVDDAVVARASVNPAAPVLPGTPPRFAGPVLEVPTRTGRALQAALNQARAQFLGQRPVIHLVGEYLLDTVLVVPAGSDARLVGDVPWPNQEARIKQNNAAMPRVITVRGPSHLALLDVQVYGAQPDALVIENADQVDGRVFLDQLNANAFLAQGKGVWVNGLNNTLVEARHHYFFSSEYSLRLDGATRVNLLGGNSGTFASPGPSYGVAGGGRLLVQDNWFESRLRLPALKLAGGAGTLTLQGHKMQYLDAGTSPTLLVEGFTGRVSVLGSRFYGAALAVRGATPGLNFLLAGSVLDRQDSQASSFANTATAGQVALVGNSINAGGGYFDHYPNAGTPTDAWLRDMFAHARAEHPTPQPLPALPAAVTDVRLYRVSIVSAGWCLQLNTQGRPTVTGTASAAAAPTLALWPNPARQAVQVRVPAGIPDAPVQLFDGQGRLVRTGRVHQGAATVSVAGLAPGLYLVRLATPGQPLRPAHLVVE